MGRWSLKDAYQVNYYPSNDERSDNSHLKQEITVTTERVALERVSEYMVRPPRRRQSDHYIMVTGTPPSLESLKLKDAGKTMLRGENMTRSRKRLVLQNSTTKERKEESGVMEQRSLL
ncbi:hypothetical protein Tco_0558755 [Tanacetum coccineum]